VDPSPFKPDKKVIGYMGTRTHDDDLLMVLPALKAVCGRHPEVEIQIIGVAGHSETNVKIQDLPIRFIKPDQGEETYPNFMFWYTGWVSWDIAIAPLVDSKFNRAKSDIKFLDYAAVGAAGIYSDVVAYWDSVIHGEDGLLVSNHQDAWIAALEQSLVDHDLRHRLAGKAMRKLYGQRTLNQCAERWLTAIHSE
jgi:glycosyltransferase involved in cell wall biosynthesis